MAAANVEHHKLVLLGDTAVGKSCLAVRFVRDEFSEMQEPTIGAAFSNQSISLSDRTVRFDIWDTAGQERYRSLAPMYYRAAGAAVVVYDITNKESFDGAKSWIAELKRKGDPNVVIALAGNKADMIDKRAVDVDEAREYAKSNGIVFLETSALSGQNVREVFVEIARKMPRDKKAAGGVVVSDGPAEKKKCC